MDVDYSQYTNLELAQCVFGDDCAKQLYQGSLAALFIPEDALQVDREQVDAASELIKRWMKQEFRLLAAPLSSPALIKEYVGVFFGGQKTEGFTALLLDGERQLKSVEEMFRGKLEKKVVTARAIVQRIIDRDGIIVIFVHRLPSSSVEPSSADVWLANYLKKVLAVLKVEIVDYVVVVGRKQISFAKRRLL